jgi:hypothetical protein
VSRAQARRDASNVEEGEGDRICGAVLALLAYLGENARDPGYDPVPTSEASFWLDALDAETRAGWPR